MRASLQAGSARSCVVTPAPAAAVDHVEADQRHVLTLPLCTVAAQGAQASCRTGRPYTHVLLHSKSSMCVFATLNHSHETVLRRWREERKRNFPSAANLAARESEAAAREARGELDPRRAPYATPARPQPLPVDVVS